MSPPTAKLPCDGPTGRSPKAAPKPPSTPHTVDSQVLLQGHALLWIRHRGETYRLQATRQGKLILTK